MSLLTIRARRRRASSVGATQRRRVSSFVVLWFAGAGLTLLAPGCYGRNCDGDVVVVSDFPHEGRMTSADTWESSSVEGPWLPFPRKRRYVFQVPQFGGRTPDKPLAWVSTAAFPRGVGFSQAGGNLGVFDGLIPNGFEITNDTCSDYYVRVVIDLPPLPSSPRDGGSDNGDANADADSDGEGGDDRDDGNSD